MHGMLLATFCLGASIRTPPSAAPRAAVADGLWRLRGGADEGGPGQVAEWDYIIIGGGAAGCVLAERLTADTENRVLVIEAGTDGRRDMRIRVPAGLIKVFKSERDWDFETEPVSGTDRGVYLCRGKVLGGSSSTNVMLYHRGSPADYERWVQAGAEGWGPAEVLNYYRRAENNVDGASQYHGIGGPMPVTEVPYENPLSVAFMRAAGELGYRRNNDFNDWSAPQDGFGQFKVTQSNGERCSTANAYLPNGRANLDLKLGAHVTKVCLEGDESTLCASGVEYISNDGSPQVAQLAAGGEVILCAGAVQSPQLLMLSGIGPRQHLEDNGIEVRKELAGVGSNLQDHPAVLVSCDAKRRVSVTDEIRLFGTGVPNPITLARWMLFGKGALTSVACEYGGFFRSSQDASEPDVQIRFVAAKALSPDGISTLEKMGAGERMESGYTTQILACRPKSVGTVRLRSADPMAKPIMDGVHLSSSSDIKVLREGIKLGRKLCQAGAFADHMKGEVYPGETVQSDAEIDAYVQRTVHSGNALTGSCRMGRSDDAGAVLDPQMRVKGVGSLRVIDASAMPTIVGGQTCAPTIMMAEKGAELVLQQRQALKMYQQQAEQAAAAAFASDSGGPVPVAAAAGP